MSFKSEGQSQLSLLKTIQKQKQNQQANKRNIPAVQNYAQNFILYVREILTAAFHVISTKHLGLDVSGRWRPESGTR